MLPTHAPTPCKSRKCNKWIASGSGKLYCDATCQKAEQNVRYKENKRSMKVQDTNNSGQSKMQPASQTILCLPNLVSEPLPEPLSEPLSPPTSQTVTKVLTTNKHTKCQRITYVTRPSSVQDAPEPIFATPQSVTTAHDEFRAQQEWELKQLESQLDKDRRTILNGSLEDAFALELENPESRVKKYLNSICFHRREFDKEHRDWREEFMGRKMNSIERKKIMQDATSTYVMAPLLDIPWSQLLATESFSGPNLSRWNAPNGQNFLATFIRCRLLWEARCQMEKDPDMTIDILDGEQRMHKNKLVWIVKLRVKLKDVPIEDDPPINYLMEFVDIMPIEWRFMQRSASSMNFFDLFQKHLDVITNDQKKAAQVKAQKRINQDLLERYETAGDIESYKRQFQIIVSGYD